MGRGRQQLLRFSKKHQDLVSPSEPKLIRQTMPDELFNRTQPIRLTREGFKNGRGGTLRPRMGIVYALS